MSHERIELCVKIPGPKQADEPLEKIEQFALKRFNPELLEALEQKKVQRIIDYTGNYFLLFAAHKKEDV